MACNSHSTSLQAVEHLGDHLAEDISWPQDKSVQRGNGQAIPSYPFNNAPWTFSRALVCRVRWLHARIFQPSGADSSAATITGCVSTRTDDFDQTNVTCRIRPTQHICVIFTCNEVLDSGSQCTVGAGTQNVCFHRAVSLAVSTHLGSRCYCLSSGKSAGAGFHQISTTTAHERRSDFIDHYQHHNPPTKMS